MFLVYNGSKNMITSKLLETMKKTESILLDGIPVSLCFDETGNEV